MFLMQISIPAPMSKELLCPEQNHFGLCSVLEGITCLQQIWKDWYLKISANLIELLKTWRKGLHPNSTLCV